MSSSDKKFIGKIFANLIKHKYIHNAVLQIESGDGHFSWHEAYGELLTNNRYFLSDVTKLFITAVVMRLEDEKLLRIDDRISKYLPEEITSDINLAKGNNSTKEITIGQLLSDTSGESELLGERTSGWIKFLQLKRSFKITIQQKSNFEIQDKDFFSEYIYQLLGRIVETATGKSLIEIMDAYVCKPLDLRNTHFYSEISSHAPAPLYAFNKKLWHPHDSSSSRIESGIVSTADDTMRFMKAFFTGMLFPKENIEKLKQWKLVRKPAGLIYQGAGIQKIWRSKLLNIYNPMSETIGYCGRSGSFAWYNPDIDLYFCGTTNQISVAGYVSVIKAINKMLKAAQ